MGLADEFDKKREQDIGWNQEKWAKLSTHKKLNHLRESLLEENREIESLIKDLPSLAKPRVGREERYHDTYYVISSLVQEMKADLDELFNNLHVRVLLKATDFVERNSEK